MRPPYKPVSREDAQAALTTFLLAKTCQDVQEIKTELGKLKITCVVPECGQADSPEKIKCGPGGLANKDQKIMCGPGGLCVTPEPVEGRRPESANQPTIEIFSNLSKEEVRKMAERDVMFYEMFSRLAGLVENFVNAKPMTEANQI
ncbi:hypothetical protein HQ571_05870 [Candidatus Kuenenbacteria bacterium]|nr:hypothetical protein [Candidatus Kuenenbacteria bacterium]